MLTTDIGGDVCSGIIVETEAYRGEDDRGAHSFGQKMTNRNKTMFDPGGRAYVYICYGIHPMLNVVINSEHIGDAVLIRAVQPLHGVEIMQRRRQFVGRKPYCLTNGPGKTAVAFGIDISADSSLLYDTNSQVRISKSHHVVNDIYEGQRVGMSTRIETCAFRPWRFYIQNNPWVSHPRHIDYRLQPKFKAICNT